LALTPHQTDALLREVDDAVRQDDMLSFWRKYGRLLVAGVILALAAFGGWLIWQNHRANVAQANSEQFATLLKTAQGATLDQAAYDKLIKEGGAAYKTEAELVKAALASGKNDTATAITTYDAILADASAPAPMKDAALIRKTALAFDGMKPEEVVTALKGLAVPGNAWFGSAGELTAIAYLKMGRRDLAAELFTSLTRDPVVPESIKLRAGQLASMLGSPVASDATPAAVRASEIPGAPANAAAPAPAASPAPGATPAAQ